ncbi:hypothetical protein O3G_MSEX014439 [Manduca sexta]|uniref:Uncharacterized protein n=1 Tax=Manduca sexta TaxID=7130 RepID=A0A922CZM1_MANSE|nr:hypothetical protein O3G_MSEX014439 [Manduca sexta]KAG6464317.1 hypothetical protein O3G_MSEX014439 [Manduca sexta]
MSTKFYVYGGGRWRELDLNTGRVSGWAKSARIVVARNGRLECSRNAPILRALRALAAGEPSRARDGPRLPHTRWTEEEHPTQKQLHNSPCRHCCHHRYTAVVENVCQHLPSEQPVRSPLVPPLLHQPALSSTRRVVGDEILDKLRNECVNQPEQSSISAQVRSPQKRATRASSASKDVRHSAAHRIKRQRVSSSSSVECLSNDINNKNDRQGNGKRVQLEKQKKKLERRGRPPKQSPANILGVVATAIPIPNPNSVQPLCITSGKWNSPSTPNKANVQPNGDISHTEQSPESNHIAAPSSVLSSANEDSQASSDKSDSNEASDESGSKSDDEESPQIAETSALLAHKLHSSGHAASVGQSHQNETPATTKVCKELVIEEKDVIALRGFLRRSAPGVSLNRFDNDDEYKRSIFYRLHPLVSVERSARIQEMLSEQDDISLRDFASQLGLRSISDDPLPRRETPNGTITKTSRARKQPDRYSEILPQPSKSPVKKLFTSTKSPTRKKSLSKSSTSSKRRSHKKAKLKPSPSVKLTSHENDGSKLLPSEKTSRKNIDLLSQSQSPIKRVTRENDMSNSSTPKKISQPALAKVVGSSKKTSHRNISKSTVLVETTNHEVALNSPAPKQITAHENGVSSKTAITLSSGDRAPKPREPPPQIALPLRDQPRRKLETIKPAHSRGGKEYTPSEDTAIVTWVSSEGRARLVNGNRMWRELQGQYEQLTGTCE